MTSILAKDVTGPLLRAARALACIKAEELALMTKLGLATIKRAEASDGTPTITEANAERIFDAYKKLGVTFTYSEGGVGVQKAME